MDRQEIESKVNEIIVETLDVKPDLVSAAEKCETVNDMYDIVEELVK